MRTMHVLALLVAVALSTVNGRATADESCPINGVGNEERRQDCTDCWSTVKDVQDTFWRMDGLLKCLEKKDKVRAQAREAARQERADYERASQEIARQRAADMAKLDAELDLMRYEEEEAARKAALAAHEKKQRQYEAGVASKTKALKEQCGADYMAPAVGMAEMRLKQCVPGLGVHGQVDAIGGVVTTYRRCSGSLCLFVDTQGGRVVSWFRG